MRTCTAAESGFSATDAGPRCTREALWAGETERGVDAVERKLVLVSGTSKFRRLLDGDSFCFNRFIHDRSLFSVMVMRVRDKRRSRGQSPCHGKIRERASQHVFDTLLRHKGHVSITSLHGTPITYTKLWTQFVPSEGGHARFTFAPVTHQLLRMW